MVVAGAVERLTRSDDGETIFIESSNLARLGPDDVAGPASGFDVDGVWALRDVADPLAEPIRVEGLGAVAFLYRRGDGSGRFTPGPQGLYVGCLDSQVSATNVIEPAPAGAAGLSVAALTTAVGSVFVEPSATSSVPPATEPAAAMLPLHRQNPSFELGVDGTPLAELLLGFEEWDGERVDPPEPEASVGVVVSEGADLELVGDQTATATVTFFRLDETLRFIQDSRIEWNGTDVTTPAPRPGTWYVDVRAVLGTSAEYEGEGVLRAGAWLHVTPSDASCDTPSATPFLGPDSNVTGVVDREGCPVVAADATLDLGSMTPWNHCAPWPPTLQWRTGDRTMTRFWQYVSDSSEINDVTAPDDAKPSGRFMPAGQILSAESEPNAPFVRAQDGTTQRWIVPDEEISCT